MKKIYFLKINLSFLAVITFLYFVSLYVYCEDSDVVVSNEFVDMEFQIDSKKFISKKISTNLDTAPEIKNNITMLPFRAFLEELGYLIEWNGETRLITASDGKNIIKLTINSKTAYVNGKTFTLENAPYIKNGRTLIPLRFVAENSGANVEWIAETRTIKVSRLGEYNTGSVLFYDQTNRSKDKRNAYIYDGKSVVKIPLNNQLIKNSLPYKGSILITLLESEIDSYNLVTYKDGKFKVLLENFEIVDTLEFNDTMIIQGYDREKKINNLYRYDGVSLIKIEENFTIGEYIIYKGKLVINKYDSYRNYSIVTIDKDWVIKELKENFIIKDKIVEDDLLFITSKESSGDKSPFSIFNGEKFDVIHDDLDMDLERTILYESHENGQSYKNIITVAKNIATKGKEYFVVLRNQGGDSEEYELYDMTVDYQIIVDSHVDKTPSRLTVSMIKKFNNEIYVHLNGTYSLFKTSTLESYIIEQTDENKKIIESTMSQNGKFIKLTEATTINYDCDFVSSKIFENQLLVQIHKKGKIIQSDKDYILNLFNINKSTNDTELSVIRDVKKIEKVLEHVGKLFIDVIDIDRLTEEERHTLILFDPTKELKYQVKNLVIGLETKSWETIKGGVVINGYEEDIDKYKMYLYSDEFHEVLSNFKSSYIIKIGDRVYASGLDEDTNKTDLYVIDSTGKELIKENFDASKIEEALNDFFFINAKITNKNSKHYNKKILYIWNKSTNEFTDIEVDIDLTDIVHFK